MQIDKDRLCGPFALHLYFTLVRRVQLSAINDLSLSYKAVRCGELVLANIE